MNELKRILERKVLPYVEKPMRYVGNELNMISKELSSVTVHGVFCFPDLYDIGMSHYGLQILYHIVNRNPKWAMSRAFHPWPDAEILWRELNVPLYTLEYFSPVKNADWIGFSLQYELQYTNMVNMLDLAGVPVFSKDRVESDPLILAGGSCMVNPEPIAQFVDICVIGDGEKAIEEICQVVEKLKIQGSTRNEKLSELSKIGGVYVPMFTPVSKKGRFTVAEKTDMQVRPAKIPHLDSADYPDHPLVPLVNVVHHRMAVEVMRGCTRGCRFCSAGMYYRPLRERDPQSVHAQIENGVNATGWLDVGLLSLSTADHTCFTGLLHAALELKKEKRISISLPSTRVDALSDEQVEMLDRISSFTSFTIAPEAGSRRLRQVINKDFSDEAILDTVNKLLSRNVQTLKLYFMIGLPTETQEDIDAIVSLTSRIADLVLRRSRRRGINVAISPFSPKANTPFQWAAMDTPESLNSKGHYIKQSLRSLKNVKVSYRAPNMTLLETLMARGDRDMGELIYAAWKIGSRLDGWEEYFDMERWQRASMISGIPIEPYLQEIPTDTILPWATVSTGVSTEFLLREYELAIKGETTPDCRSGACSVCGVCDETIGFSIPGNDQQNFTPVQVMSAERENIGTFHYRVSYTKGERIRFLGHLDMVEVFRRAFLTASIPLAYSQGYNPLPRISFGPPLPFGVWGSNEFLDIVTTRPLEESARVIDVNSWLPDGLRILGVGPVTGKVASLSSSIYAGRYTFIPGINIESDLMRKSLNQVLDSTCLTVERNKSGTGIQIDVRPYILQLSMNETGDVPGWDALLSLEPGASCKPSELLAVLCPGRSIHEFNVCRRACLVR